MKADNCKYVSVSYRISVEEGQAFAPLGSSPGPVGFVFGASQILKGVERSLRGLEPGERANFRLEPHDAFGSYEESFVTDLPRSSFPSDQELEPGMVLVAQSPRGAVPFTVRSVSAETVRADFNHPLAGQTLFFDVTVEEVRDLTAIEMLAEGTRCSLESCPA
jgi:FKBP-type peptidyl-prolyl cis-trans isomerase SlyD